MTTPINQDPEADLSPKRALLVSVYKGNDQKAIAEEHLQELELLSQTFGLDIVGKECCSVRKFEAATFITKGKLEELIERAKALQADVVVFDDEVAPSQQRNLQVAFGISVMDRTGVILEVFAQRAQTKEARLQIELAQVKYQAPRLKRLWSHLSRQKGTGSAGGGGGGYNKGEGEKQIEIDRRILKRDIDQLQKELLEVQQNRELQRSFRQKTEIPVFAIVGYTNAGKSTLLNALTDAKVFVEDKLFATLDTTTRKFSLPNNQDILLIDTVGFIRKLPHLLVAAFKSTLEEAIQADFLIHLVDVSHPMAEEQAETTFEVLKELGAKDKPILTVLNKVDKVEDPAVLLKMRLKYPNTFAISALKQEGFSELLAGMVEALNSLRKRMHLRIPQSEYAKVGEVRRLGNVIQQDYEENDVLLVVDLPHAATDKFMPYVVES